MSDRRILPPPHRLAELPALTANDINWGFDGQPEMQIRKNAEQMKSVILQFHRDRDPMKRPADHAVKRESDHEH